MSSTRDLRDESGIVVILVAVSMALLLAVAALVIDIGNGRVTKRTAQSTADAASLAGAQEFMSFPTTTPQPADWNRVSAAVKLYAQQNMGIPSSDWNTCTDPNIGSYIVIPSPGVPVGSCVSVDSTSAPTRVRVKLPTRTMGTTLHAS